MTNETDRQRLLYIARTAIAAHVTAAALPDVDGADSGWRAGAFVTLHVRGELRGCIGHLEPDDDLPRIVGRCAVAACSSDPRFSPVNRAEIDALSIEISIVGPLELLR